MTCADKTVTLTCYLREEELNEFIKDSNLEIKNEVVYHHVFDYGPFIGYTLYKRSARTSVFKYIHAIYSPVHDLYTIVGPDGELLAKGLSDVESVERATEFLHYEDTSTEII